MKLGALKTAGLLCLLAAGITSTVMAQDQTPKAAAKQKPSMQGDVSDALPDILELDPFGGVSLFGQINQGLSEKLVNGGTGGGRVAFNLSRYMGIEFSYNFSGNNVRLSYADSSRITQL